ncbi:MAG: relaxase/mobilization nuclease domain-containing protein [Pseudomonadales bacterium]|nr:relaxase/mobilization nuclease domain-containing protein [Pseudomonadales bacterium]
MIPRIQKQGRSFKGAVQYITHDKMADTGKRMEWFETGNILTNDPEKAARVMAWTDSHADALKRDFGGSMVGRKTETGAVYHYSISWAEGDNPDQEHQRQQALSSLDFLGLSEHQYVMAAHNDTKNPHVHLVVNLTHPGTGKRADLAYDKRRLQEWALEYELEHGMHCTAREENAEQRKQEGAKEFSQSQKEKHGVMVTRAYEASDDGKSFKAALEAEGLQLAKGRKAFMVVDSDGEKINLARVIEGHRTADIKAKLGDLDRDTLPDFDGLAEQVQEANEKHENEAQQREQEEAEKSERDAEKLKEEFRGIAESHREKKAAEIKEIIETKKAWLAVHGRMIEGKKQASLESWEIDKFTEQRDEAKNRLLENSGVFARLTGRKRRAAEALEEAQSILDERMQRYETDLEAIKRIPLFSEQRPAIRDKLVWGEEIERFEEIICKEKEEQHTKTLAETNARFKQQDREKKQDFENARDLEIKENFNEEYSRLQQEAEYAREQHEQGHDYDYEKEAEEEQKTLI